MVELNQRILLNDSKGVVKYYGELEVTNGFWVGVDWDDKNRGKHDGSYKGKKYFKAFSNTSGSFLRENDLDFEAYFSLISSRRSVPKSKSFSRKKEPEL
ncbi:CAP-Gly domain-containing protein [Meloidogyne graminicola]|uniref:CAP-Gly domain-containing protein n=1 Tax=Meloidogyne graminicola TaxID=189291 RepID=A0A8S9ZX57_9BILA|nr:CAP-Gly domain-containing protein [Meloidogyne graminicola]